jgi:hypothetical protein
VIRWDDGDSGSSRDALTAVAVRAFLLGALFGFARGLLAHREPHQSRTASPTPSRTAPRDLRPWDDTPVEETLDVEPLTVGRTR